MAQPQSQIGPATYQDVLDAPPHKIAELINGELMLQPRPAKPHSRAGSILGMLLGPPYQLARGGPGGWDIVFEPEMHLGEQVLVPDLGGWRSAAKTFEEPNLAFHSTPPDWVCEVLSPSTQRIDRLRKMPIYAQHGVQYVWLVHPIDRTVEVYRLTEGQWLLIGTHADAEVVHLEPFQELGLELEELWLPQTE